MTAQQLRNSILQQAIQGRLVPQDPNDEPASVLLERIRKEKEQLVKEGKLKKKDLVTTPIADDEKPFDIPSGWEWCRTKSIFNVCSARRVHEKDWRDKGIPFYRAREIGKLADLGHVSNDLFIDKELYDEFSKSGVPHGGDLMVTAVGTLGKVYVVKENEVFYYKDGSVLCFENIGHVDASYLKYVIESPFYKAQYEPESGGTTVATLTMVRVNEYLIPLPPLAEQRRIVAKIEELMPLVKKYGKAQEELDKLNKDLPQKLRQSILQDAIQGKLVPQDPAEEPASILLNRLRNEKEDMISKGLLKKEKPQSTISDDEKPFLLPSGWEWVRLGDYCKKVTDQVASGSFASIRENVKSLKSPDYAIMVKTADFSNNFSRNLTYTDRHGYEFLENSNLFGGELILSNIGSIGKVFIVPNLDVPMTLAPNSVMARLIDEQLRDYLVYFLQSPQGYEELMSITSGTAMKKFNKTDLKTILIPVPPLAEQKRIVAKIEELFAEIDKLK